MAEWSSRLDIGDSVDVGDIKARVSGIRFDDKIAAPLAELTWFANGQVYTKWIRESVIRSLVEGELYGK